MDVGAEIARRNESRARELAGRNFFAEMLDLRDAQRDKNPGLLKLVQGDKLPWEVNQHGIIRWFVAPTMDDVLVRTALVYEQRIPMGSRSGRQRQQGGIAGYVRSGRGYSIVNEDRHEWEMDDVIQIPLLRDGCVFQHFCSGDEDAVILWCQPNLVEQLGVDRGCGFEQLEPCPEYEGRSEVEV